MLATLFIVWRESVEALLVIGILYAWIKRERISGAVSQLWLGSALGLVLAGILALAIYFAGSWYAGRGGEWFQTGMMAVAALLILQMIIWMHRHGRSMKKNLEKEAAESATKAGGFGIMLLCMLAVAREGAETVVFLMGVGSQQTGTDLWLFVVGGVIGFGLAIVSFLWLQIFSKIISWKWFFRISEFALLLVGGGLFISAVDKASGLISEWDLPEWVFAFMGDPIWDTSAFIPDSSTLTGLTGYHAIPSLMQVSALALYWLVAILFCSLQGKSKTPRGTPQTA